MEVAPFMNLSGDDAREFASFPAVLRALVEGEVRAGNAVVEIGHGFPAAPCGAWVRLAGRVSTVPRKRTEALDFFERNTGAYSGEFTDAARHYFVLEPPIPPAPPPDMDAIRASIDARNRAADCDRDRYDQPELPPLLPSAEATPRIEVADTPVTRFARSMVLSYDAWHDGVGYDLDALASASPEELVALEELMLARGIEDWRDVEALAALASPRSRVLLRRAKAHRDPLVRLALSSHAPDLLTDAERTQILVDVLGNPTEETGMTQALLEVERFHPPAVVHALLGAILTSSGENAVHLAALAMFVHGRAECAFDWSLRPWLLAFDTADRGERVARFRDLCARIGVDAGIYLPASGP